MRTNNFSLLESIEVHEFLYEKEDIVRPHASLWGRFLILV